jgi:DegV family protein with EDD domain
MNKIGLVTDSTSDLPAEMVEKYAIGVVPAILVIEGLSYRDGEGITREIFYERLPDMRVPPTTAAPSACEFLERYEEQFQAGAERVLSLHLPARLSGMCNSACLAAESFKQRVQVLDCGQLSMGLGFQVLAAAEAIAAGEALHQVLAHIEAVRKRLRVVALLDTLEYLRRSGRVSWAKAALGGFLNVKPLVELREGSVESLGAARTSRQGRIRLLEMLRQFGPLERLALLHTNAETAAHQLLADLDPQPPLSPLVVNVTTVIGTHVGPNGLGFAALPAQA